MSGVLIGTDSGVLRLAPGAPGPEPEAGPSGVTRLARAGDAVLGATREGALWKRTGGASWQLVDERPVPDEIWALGADSRLSGRLYLGVSPALLYRSDDSGETWEACDSVRQIPGYKTWTFPPPPHIAHVRSIAADPQEVGAVYIGVEEGGVYWSPDGGETWESRNEGLYWDVHTVVPGTQPDRLYATTGRGFHRSDDGGRHWRHITTGLDRSYTVPCVTLAQHSDCLVTAAAATPPNRWNEGGPNPGLYRSDDGGEHWVHLEADLPAFPVMPREIAVDARGALYVAAGQQLLASEDEGRSWKAVAEDLPAIRALVGV